ncbi:MAG: M23 family metallopeptidase [Clostridia bacterium]|nr:M23 family metallopeptidase [Clostridia bacterium]
MKKTVIALIIIILLCSAVFAAFYLVTQRGALAFDACFYADGDFTGPAVCYDAALYKSNALLDAVRSSEKSALTDFNGYYKGTLQVTYKPDITMDYTVLINPWSGIGLIEKGLLSKKYFLLEPSVMEFLLEPISLGIVSPGDGEPEPINCTGAITAIPSSLVFQGGRPEMSKSTREYKLHALLTAGFTLEYDLFLDMESGNAFARTPSGYYSIPEECAEVLFSLDSVFPEYISINQPIPMISLTAPHVLIPLSTESSWTHVKPSGDEYISNPSHLESNVSQTIEAGTQIKAVFEDENAPDRLSLVEIRDGEIHKTFDLLSQNAFVPSFEGLIEYRLEAFYDANNYPGSHGTVVQRYIFDMNLPSEAKMLYSAVHPGDVLAFFVDYADEGESYSIKSNLKGFTGELMPYNDSLIIYIPVNWWTSPGTYYAELYKTVPGETELFEKYSITVLPDNFETTNQQLVVSDELADKASADASAYDAMRVAAAKARSNPTSYLEGAFVMPLDGELGTSFGRTRYINGANPYRHSGLDIDGETGDPIVAGNSGVVVMAEELIRCGNTVIIDHGMNLFTSYLHMSAFDVSVGDFVEKGDLIGKVGSTGFSTGSHLHWAATLNGNYISPLWLVENPIVPME